MSKVIKKVAVLIGRFQILHNEHVRLINHALDNSDQLIILVGSSDLARDPKNPFTFEERKSVINKITNTHDKVVNILPLHDYVYDNNKWLRDVTSLVSTHALSTDITLFGCKKDDSSYYLEFFPQWKQNFINLDVDVSATEYRNKYYEEMRVSSELPQYTQDFLNDFSANDQYKYLVDWHEYNKVYQKRFESFPYVVPFLTGDAIVVCCGHILLVKRKAIPGKGLWAMPGGFFNSGFEFNKEGYLKPTDKVDYSTVDSAIRELREETGLKVPEPVLRGSIVRTDEFGDPNRSLRWRIITKAVYIQLQDTTLPYVKGQDDAEKAFWIPISELKQNRHMFFEDHLNIIDSFLGIL